MKTLRFLFIAIVLFAACQTDSEKDDKQTGNRKEKEQTEEKKKVEEMVSTTGIDEELFGELAIAEIAKAKKVRLTEIKQDGATSEKFQYDSKGRLSVWENEDQKRIFYDTNGRISKVESWSDTFDGWEKEAEDIYEYEGGKLKKVKRFSIEDGRELTERLEIKFNGKGQISEIWEYDMFEEASLNYRSVYTYDVSGRIVQVENHNEGGKIYERITYQYNNALHPFAYLRLPTLLFDFGVLNLFSTNTVTTEKVLRGHTITETTKISADEAGLVTKAVLTLPRRAEPVYLEYIYEEI